jgi:hypothetical protein
LRSVMSIVLYRSTLAKALVSIQNLEKVCFGSKF